MTRVLHFDYKHHDFQPMHERLKEALEGTEGVEYSYLRSTSDGAYPFIPPNKRRLEDRLGETDVLLIAPGMMEDRPEKQRILEDYLERFPQLRIGILTPNLVPVKSPIGYAGLPENLPTFSYNDQEGIVAYVLSPTN